MLESDSLCSDCYDQHLSTIAPLSFKFINLETRETIRNKCTNSLPIVGRTTLNGGSVTILCPNQIITAFTATSGVQSTLTSSDTLTALRSRAPSDLPPARHAVELDIVVFRSYPDANILGRYKQ